MKTLVFTFGVGGCETFLRSLFVRTMYGKNYLSTYPTRSYLTLEKEDLSSVSDLSSKKCVLCEVSDLISIVGNMDTSKTKVVSFIAGVGHFHPRFDTEIEEDRNIINYLASTLGYDVFVVTMDDLVDNLEEAVDSVYSFCGLKKNRAYYASVVPMFQAVREKVLRGRKAFLTH